MKMTYHCEVCGEPFIRYDHIRKVPRYNIINGEPIYIETRQRCSKNPCHQGHIWSKSDNKILSWIIKWVLYMSIGDLVECEICGKKSVMCFDEYKER